MFNGVSLGTTPLEPFGNREFTILNKRDCVAELLSHFMRIMYTQSNLYKDSEKYKMNEKLSKFLMTLFTLT